MRTWLYKYIKLLWFTALTCEAYSLLSLVRPIHCSHLWGLLTALTCEAYSLLSLVRPTHCSHLLGTLNALTCEAYSMLWLRELEKNSTNAQNNRSIIAQAFGIAFIIIYVVLIIAFIIIYLVRIIAFIIIYVVRIIERFFLRNWTIF